MAIAFKELAGSPIEDYSGDGFTATRYLLCAWDDRRALAAKLMGDGYLFGGNFASAYPDTTGVYAMRVHTEPFHDDVTTQVLEDLTEGLNSYSGFAKVVATYEMLGTDNDTGDREDMPETERETFLTYRMDIGGEMMELPSQHLHWASGVDILVPPKAVPLMRIPIVEHHMNWHRVIAPPWKAISKQAGTLNAEEFLGAPAESILFEGATADIEFIGFNGLLVPEKCWRLNYVFREKRYKDQQDADNPLGWNHTYRPLPIANPGWDKLWDANNDPLYQSTDFADLFKCEVPEIE